MEVHSQRNRLAAIVAGHAPRSRYALALGLTALAVLFPTGCRCTGTPEACVNQYNCVSYPDSTFFGHYPTCWKQWPAEWVGCPGEYAETVEPVGPAGQGAEMLPTPPESNSKRPSDAEPKTPDDSLPRVVSPPELSPKEPPLEPSAPPPSEPSLTPPPDQSRRRVPRISTASFAPPDLPPPPMPISVSTLRDTKLSATSHSTPLLVAPLPAVEGPAGLPRSNGAQVRRTPPMPAEDRVSETRPQGITGKIAAPMRLPDARPASSRRTARAQPARTFTPAG